MKLRHKRKQAQRQIEWSIVGRAVNRYLDEIMYEEIRQMHEESIMSHIERIRRNAALPQSWAVPQ